MVSELELEKIKTDVMSVGMLNGADEENRTPVSTMARSCSTIELHPQNKKMAVQTGLEPATPSVTGRYANQLRHWTVHNKTDVRP